MCVQCEFVSSKVATLRFFFCEFFFVCEQAEKCSLKKEEHTHAKCRDRNTSQHAVAIVERAKEERLLFRKKKK